MTDVLSRTVRNCPLIDNHAHNLLRPEFLDLEPFESITTEAEGSALKHTFTSLPHLRARKQLRQLYGCKHTADWEDILKRRAELLQHEPDALWKKCFHGTYAILMDDGLGAPEKVHPFSWHDRLTEAPTKRILRIEAVAEHIIQDLLCNASERNLEAPEFLIDTWALFTDRLEAEIMTATKDPDVIAFKSVVCYRTGLDVEPDYNECLLNIGKPFEHYIVRCIRKRKFRIQRKIVNDFVVLKLLEIISEQAPYGQLTKPVQFHTGLGDADISLLRSNPAFLQPLIEQYPNIPFVLLHSAYPYTREAGWLSTVYKNCFLDLGLVFPMVSRDGQISILHQALEVVPGSKLLYSTDGHWFPETFWLANMQFREALEVVLLANVNSGLLDIFEAITLAMDILFNNSNTLYDLQYQVDLQDRVRSLPQALTLQPKLRKESFRVNIMDRFLKKHASIKFVYVQWLDYMGTMRMRVLPVASFEHLVRSDGRIGISLGHTGTLQNDEMTPTVNKIDQIYVEPDLSTLRRCHNKDPLSAAMVLGFWRDCDGNPVKKCPRTGLQTIVDSLSVRYAISLFISFKIEATLLRRTNDANDPFEPITTTHAWSTLSSEQWLAIPLLAEIAENLSDLDIGVQQFHAKAGRGQFEFVLEPLPPLAAIDALIQARLVIHQIASTHNLRATLYPSPLPGIRTAAHAHISMTPTYDELRFWVGGVLNHIDALCAITMPEEVSYRRAVDNQWTGGTWVSWGTQNCETPLRRVDKGRWEVRCIDGMANMYLAVSAILGAGLLGLMYAQSTEDLPRDCSSNPSQLSAEQLKSYNIHKKMPVDIREAHRALEDDTDLREALPAPFTADYLAMKKVELKLLADMTEENRRVWMIERY
ncbi:developmental protein-like protein fluG [Pseudovirgaria hyperparasitica]|uniref:Developmental protein-like protein fluG n=1 Tax=Pseudovirgaria hyperparasitica TaxID=470096 RepID=A0A6A6W8N0_9PEZI|nr:developmental protein-like protein fluG [Pseudovirgaria hyperparasitica]KAF2758280.1 developmental protein-like protein fluG [Pseudovirgaria hyperparasitica]